LRIDVVNIAPEVGEISRDASGNSYSQQLTPGFPSHSRIRRELDMDHYHMLNASSGSSCRWLSSSDDSSVTSYDCNLDCNHTFNGLPPSIIPLLRCYQCCSQCTSSYLHVHSDISSLPSDPQLQFRKLFHSGHTISATT